MRIVPDDQDLLCAEPFLLQDARKDRLFAGAHGIVDGVDENLFEDAVKPKRCTSNPAVTIA